MSEIYNYTEKSDSLEQKVKKISYNKKYSDTEYIGEFNGNVSPQEGEQLSYYILEYYDENNQLLERYVEIRTPHENESDYPAYEYKQVFRNGKLFMQSVGFLDDGLRKFLQGKATSLHNSNGYCYYGKNNAPRPERGLTYMSLKDVYYNDLGLPCLITASGYGVGYRGFVSKNNIAIHYNTDNLVDAIIEYHFSDVSLANLLPQSAKITIFKTPLHSLDEYVDQKSAVVAQTIHLDINGGLQALQIEDKNGFEYNLNLFLSEHCPEVLENNFTCWITQPNKKLTGKSVSFLLLI